MTETVASDEARHRGIVIRDGVRCCLLLIGCALLWVSGPVAAGSSVATALAVIAILVGAMALQPSITRWAAHWWPPATDAQFSNFS